MTLIFTWFVLWLPLLLLVASLIGVVIALASWLRRRAHAREQRGLCAEWPVLVSLALTVILVLGTVPAVTWFVARQVFKPGTRAGAVHQLVAMHQCTSLHIAEMAAYITSQPEALHHELEGLVLRATWHCVEPAPGATTPDAALKLSVSDRYHLRRMVNSHMTRTPQLPVTAEPQPYQESWIPDAQAVRGFLTWQERGLAGFEVMLADTSLAPAERTTYLGLAAAHCLQWPTDRRCATCFDAAHLATLARTNGWPNYWDAKLRAQLQAALAGRH